MYRQQFTNIWTAVICSDISYSEKEPDALSCKADPNSWEDFRTSDKLTTKNKESFQLHPEVPSLCWSRKTTGTTSESAVVSHQKHAYSIKNLIYHSPQQTNRNQNGQ